MTKPAKGPAASDEEDALPRTPRNVVYALFVAAQRSRELMAVALRDAPIRADEYGVYSAVYAAGSLTQSELARSTGMPLTTVADYVRAMVDRGHLRRYPHPADRRSVLLELTRSGIETVHVIMPAFTHAVRSLTDELDMPADQVTAALEALAGATARVTRRLEAEAPA